MAPRGDREDGIAKLSALGAVDAGALQEQRSREAESRITPRRFAHSAQGAEYRLERRSKEAEYRLERRSRVCMSGVPPRLFFLRHGRN